MGLFLNSLLLIKLFKPPECSGGFFLWGSGCDAEADEDYSAEAMVAAMKRFGFVQF